MTKRKSIISYDNLTVDQKKQILKDYPDGYGNHINTIKTPTGETIDTFIWETEDVVYLIKLNKLPPKVKNPRDDDDDDDDRDFDDDIDKKSALGDDIERENDDNSEDNYDSIKDSYDEEEDD